MYCKLHKQDALECCKLNQTNTFYTFIQLTRSLKLSIEEKNLHNSWFLCVLDGNFSLKMLRQQIHRINQDNRINQDRAVLKKRMKLELPPSKSNQHWFSFHFHQGPSVKPAPTLEIKLTSQGAQHVSVLATLHENILTLRTSKSCTNLASNS